MQWRHSTPCFKHTPEEVSTRLTWSFLSSIMQYFCISDKSMWILYLNISQKDGLNMFLHTSQLADTEWCPHSPDEKRHKQKLRESLLFCHVLSEHLCSQCAHTHTHTRVCMVCMKRGRVQWQWVQSQSGSAAWLIQPAHSPVIQGLMPQSRIELHELTPGFIQARGWNADKESWAARNVLKARKRIRVQLILGSECSNTHGKEQHSQILSDWSDVLTQNKPRQATLWMATCLLDISTSLCACSACAHPLFFPNFSRSSPLRDPHHLRQLWSASLFDLGSLEIS